MIEQQRRQLGVDWVSRLKNVRFYEYRSGDKVSNSEKVQNAKF